MYEYAYDRIECYFSGWKLFEGAVRETDDYKDVIRRRAADGWRFVTWIPVDQNGSGSISTVDLIFEKEKKQ